MTTQTLPRMQGATVEILLDTNRPTHALSRTSPIGEEFVGQCVNCGRKGYSADDVDYMCPALLESYLERITGGAY